MWSGTSALSSIDQTLQTIRNEVVRLDSQLKQLSHRMASNQRHRSKLIGDIAQVRLAEIESGQLLSSFNAADQHAAELLSQREFALEQLNSQIDATNQQISDAETERELLLAKVNESSQQIVDVEGRVQAGLKLDDAYLAQFAKAQNAESIAAEAERKMENAQASMTEKAAPYQADKLFMYLWERGFATTDYKGGLLARFMDSWVAKLIKFEPARINYWNLTEIPKRLQEHADRVAEIADEEHTALQQLEVNALSGAGVEGLESALETLRNELDAHDDRLESIEASLNQALSQRSAFLAGEDDYIQQCLTRLTQALDHQDLQSVHQYVRATTSPTDDMLVLELQSLEDELNDVEGDLSDVRSLHDRKLSKLKELELVRRNFKNSRFDDVRSGFGNQALIASVLNQFIQGVVSGSDVWRVIQRNQRHRQVASSPTFGSGGLGDIADILGEELMRQGRRSRRGSRQRSRRGSTWHWPKPRSGSGGFRLPRGGGGGGSQGGGFKTGGGF